MKIDLLGGRRVFWHLVSMHNRKVHKCWLATKNEHFRDYFTNWKNLVLSKELYKPGVEMDFHSAKDA